MADLGASCDRRSTHFGRRYHSPRRDDVATRARRDERIVREALNGANSTRLRSGRRRCHAGDLSGYGMGTNGWTRETRTAPASLDGPTGVVLCPRDHR
jgi:hypothetical protein